MAIYAACTVNLAPEAIKVRWQEPYVTSGLNQKTLGQQAKGVFAGFTVEPGPGGTLKVLLKVDPILGFSGANVLDVTTSKYCVTVIQSSTITVDLASVANGTVYITLDAQYQIGATSGAQVKVVDAAELATNANLVLLAKVNVPAAPDIFASHINMGYRLSAGDSLTLEMQPSFNLLANGSFERDTNGPAPMGWATSTLSLTTSPNPHTGTLAMRLNAGGPTTDTCVSTPMPVLAGATYVAGAWITSNAALVGGTGAHVQVEWSNAAGASLGIVDIEDAFVGPVLPIVFPSNFVERKAAVTAPVGANTARLGIRYDNCSGNVWVDDCVFLTRRQDPLSTSTLFGGPTSNADAYHTHDNSAASASYGGGVAWADGQTNPATTVEGQFDKMLVDLTSTGATSGAGKIAYTATAPQDITTARVDLALDELDYKKASLALANTFAALNTFNGAITSHPAIAPPPYTGNIGGPYAILGRGSDDGGFGVGHGIIGVGVASTGLSSGIVGLANETLDAPSNPAGVSAVGGGSGVPGLFAYGAGAGAVAALGATDDALGICFAAFPFGGGKAFDALAGDITVSTSYGFKYSSARAMTSLITAARINAASSFATYAFGTAGPAIGSATIETGKVMVAGFQVDLPLNAVITGMTMGVSHGAVGGTGLTMTYRVDQVVPNAPWTLNQVYGSAGLATVATLAGSGFEVLTATGLTGTTAFKTATEGRTFVGTITVFGTTTNFFYINYVAVTYQMLDWLGLP